MSTRSRDKRTFSPRTRVLLTGFAMVLVGVLMSQTPAGTPAQQYWPWLLIVGALLIAVIAVNGTRTRTGSAGVVRWWSWRSSRNQGVASRWIILRRASALAARSKAGVLRPSLRRLPWWRRVRVSAREFATPLARVGMFRVWSPIEDVTLRIGGPRTGKTGELAGRILDAPGAVIATSTRTDLVELTSACRSQRGSVGVFNPSGLGGYESTVRFDPLSGCERPATATARASDLLSGVSSPGGDGDREFWNNQARRVLASLLHAAALGEAAMRDVLAWVADPDNAAAEVQRFLRRSPEPAYEQEAVQFLATNERTRSSICATIMPALGWLSDATAAEAAQGNTLDVSELIERCGTVFMLGAQETTVAPLVTALTGHIAREARRLAEHQPGGRLDPPLTMALDEAALICPVPLDDWTADMGGRGVTIHIAAQSRSQLRQRWGPDGAVTIMNNAATLMIYGASRDHDDLTAYSNLTGERYEHVPTWNDDGARSSTSTRRVPVLTAAQIGQLPPRRVLIIRRNMPAAVGTVRMAWKRRDVKAAHRAEVWAERLARWRETRHRLVEQAADTLADAVPGRFGHLPHTVRRSHAATSPGPLHHYAGSTQQHSTSPATAEPAEAGGQH